MYDRLESIVRVLKLSSAHIVPVNSGNACWHAYKQAWADLHAAHWAADVVPLALA